MNVIIVAKFLKSPKKFSLQDPRSLVLLGAALGALLMLGLLAGFTLRGVDGAALAEVKRLQRQVAAQKIELEEARDSAQREINAMAARLGELQAQATRLNALGERLTRLGKLDDGEFSFVDLPGIGGAEPSEPVVDTSLTARLDGVAAELDLAGNQLALLEALLIDRDLDASLMPSGLPVRSGYASSHFGNRLDPLTGFNQFHRGIDFSGPAGADVLAVADGVVIFSGRDGNYGNLVDIDHGNGYMTRYAHNSQNLVQVGERVRAGQVIAKMGRTGRATGNHVHFEVWQNGRPVNPRQYLHRARG